MKMYITILFLAFSLGCNSINKAKNLNVTPLDSLTIKWQLDSLGCKGYRSSNIIDSVFKKYDLALKSIDSVKLILGKANVEWQNENYYGLKYFFGTICISDTLNPESDKCWIDIQFSKNPKELNSFSAACE